MSQPAQRRKNGLKNDLQFEVGVDLLECCFSCLQGRNIEVCVPCICCQGVLIVCKCRHGEESGAQSLVGKIDAADLSAEKGELVLRLLEVREEADALLADESFGRKSRKDLKRIRKLVQRFLREIRLKNGADLYSAPVK